VFVSVVESPNIPPVADAGPDQTVEDTDENGTEDITLNGSGSSDADGTVVSYEWYKGATFLGAGVEITVTLPVGNQMITLIVTDDEGATDSDTALVSITSPASTLSPLIVTAYKVKGLQKANLTWASNAAPAVDIYRDGAVIATTENDGAYTDNIDKRGGGSYTYKVCEAGTAVCSNESTIAF
jgi:serine protease